MWSINAQSITIIISCHSRQELHARLDLQRHSIETQIEKVAVLWKRIVASAQRRYIYDGTMIYENKSIKVIHADEITNIITKRADE